MKVLFVNIGMHQKNLNALLKYNIEITSIYNNNLDNIDLNSFDVVYSPGLPIEVKKYPDTKFIFGPHFSVFPQEQQMQIIKGKKTIYIQPSDWAKNAWYLFDFCRQNIRIKTLPFGVDTDAFNEILPIEKRDYIFIYYKSRNPIEFQQVMNFLSQYNFKIKIFDYLTKYSEEDYLNYLHNSKFGIWVGRHESQGFALEEALSCNVPLLVWDVKSMNQEYGYNYDDVSATCIPYWDNRCGESFTDALQLQPIFNKLIENINTYKPREFILDNLSIEKCSQKFIELVNKI
jgi:hypothetical protein